MKQILILSGKGGTGKTTISSAFIEFSRCHSFADCDVDAPNLHLVFSKGGTIKQTDYYGFKKAIIDKSRCLGCKKCELTCRFSAIQNQMVRPFECEGCGVCLEVCPAGAISMVDNTSGSLMLYMDRENILSTAQLKTGSGASGKLVTEVKKQLINEAKTADISIIDGSPGIGCPVIASISGTDLILIVVEPTISGLHDMIRIIDTTRHFGVDCTVCINKYDVNLGKTEDILKYCSKNSVPVIGKVPYDSTVLTALNRYESISCYPDSPAGKAIKSIWDNLYLKYILKRTN